MILKLESAVRRGIDILKDAGIKRFDVLCAERV